MSISLLLWRSVNVRTMAAYIGGLKGQVCSLTYELSPTNQCTRVNSCIWLCEKLYHYKYRRGISVIIIIYYYLHLHHLEARLSWFLVL